MKLKAVPQSALTRIIEQLDKPVVPKFQLPDGTWEENPNDPDYINAMDIYATDVMSAVQSAYTQLGTEVVGIPDNIPPADSDDWIEELEYAGLHFYRGAEGETLGKSDVDISTPFKRKAEWKRLVALNGAPTRELISGIAQLSGTLEAEVIRAYAWFQARIKRGGPFAGSIEELGQNGNRVETAAGGNGLNSGGNAGSEVQPNSVEPLAQTGPRF